MLCELIATGTTFKIILLSFVLRRMRMIAGLPTRLLSESVLYPLRLADRVSPQFDGDGGMSRPKMHPEFQARPHQSTCWNFLRQLSKRDPIYNGRSLPEVNAQCRKSNAHISKLSNATLVASLSKALIPAARQGRNAISSRVTTSITFHSYTFWQALLIRAGAGLSFQFADHPPQPGLVPVFSLGCKNVVCSR